MKISVGQIYVKANVSFPFSHQMQRWLGDELSSLAASVVGFESQYGADFNLVIRISADTKTPDTQIKGPTVFKKDHDVEYSVFLPYDAVSERTDGCRAAAEFLLAGIREVFCRAGVGVERLEDRTAAIIDHICSDATMLTKPWPS